MYRTHKHQMMKTLHFSSKNSNIYDSNYRITRTTLPDFPFVSSFKKHRLTRNSVTQTFFLIPSCTSYAESTVFSSYEISVHCTTLTTYQGYNEFRFTTVQLLGADLKPTHSMSLVTTDLAYDKIQSKRRSVVSVVHCSWALIRSSNAGPLLLID